MLHFRIAIPPDIRHHFNTKEIYRSLRTANVRHAMNEAKALSIAFQRIFEECRKRPMPDQNKVATDPANDFDRATGFRALPPKEQSLASIFFRYWNKA
jgi:hypothetical protein